MGGSVFGFYRGEGYGYDKFVCCGEEVFGFLSFLCVCEGDWWVDLGKY